MTGFPISRRGLMAGAAALAGLNAMPALADVSEADARAIVEEIADRLVVIANSGQSVQQQAVEFRALLAKWMAFDAVARSTLGARWRSMTPAQQSAYVEAFLDYASRKYSSRFKEFASTRLTVQKVTDYGERGVIVSSVATLPSGEKAAVDWGISDRGGADKVSNIVIEGISIVTSEREIIGSMLERRGNDIDALIAEMKKSS